MRAFDTFEYYKHPDGHTERKLLARRELLECSINPAHKPLRVGQSLILAVGKRVMYELVRVA